MGILQIRDDARRPLFRVAHPRGFHLRGSSFRFGGRQSASFRRWCGDPRSPIRDVPLRLKRNRFPMGMFHDVRAMRQHHAASAASKSRCPGAAISASGALLRRTEMVDRRDSIERNGAALGIAVSAAGIVKSTPSIRPEESMPPRLGSTTSSILRRCRRISKWRRWSGSSTPPKPFAGMQVNCVSESLKVHDYESKTLTKAFRRDHGHPGEARS